MICKNYLLPLNYTEKQLIKARDFIRDIRMVSFVCTQNEIYATNKEDDAMPLYL